MGNGTEYLPHGFIMSMDVHGFHCCLITAPKDLSPRVWLLWAIRAIV